MPKIFESLPKWQNFAQSGHTAHYHQSCKFLLCISDWEGGSLKQSQRWQYLSSFTLVRFIRYASSFHCVRYFASLKHNILLCKTAVCTSAGVIGRTTQRQFRTRALCTTPTFVGAKKCVQDSSIYILIQPSLGGLLAYTNQLWSYSKHRDCSIYYQDIFYPAPDLPFTTLGIRFSKLSISGTWLSSYLPNQQVNNLIRSPGLVVIGWDSRLEGCGFESRHRILNGHFFKLIVAKGFKKLPKVQ